MKVMNKGVVHLVENALLGAAILLLAFHAAIIGAFTEDALVSGVTVSDMEIWCKDVSERNAGFVCPPIRARHEFVPWVKGY